MSDFAEEPESDFPVEEAERPGFEDEEGTVIGADDFPSATASPRAVRRARRGPTPNTIARRLAQRAPSIHGRAVRTALRRFDDAGRNRVLYLKTELRTLSARGGIDAREVTVLTEIIDLADVTNDIPEVDLMSRVRRIRRLYEQLDDDPGTSDLARVIAGVAVDSAGAAADDLAEMRQNDPAKLPRRRPRSIVADIEGAIGGAGVGASLGGAWGAVIGGLVGGAVTSLAKHFDAE